MYSTKVWGVSAATLTGFNVKLTRFNWFVGTLMAPARWESVRSVGYIGAGRPVPFFIPTNLLAPYFIRDAFFRQQTTNIAHNGCFILCSSFTERLSINWY